MYKRLLMLIKSMFKKTINLLVSCIGKTSVGRYIFSQVVTCLINQTKTVTHNGTALKFSTPNTLNLIRVNTFSSKEPETLDWIDDMPEGSVIWDIGANIGLYSCYAAKHRDCKVFAFEPSVFNLELLARNIFLNELSDTVTIIPLPVSECLVTSKLNMTSTEWGGALSTFDKTFGYDGQQLRKTFDFTTVGISMSEAVELLNIPKPDYIKMDVDGIEHLILKGGEALISDVKSILVEINDNFKEQAESTERYLVAAGLHLTEKRCWQEDSNSLADTTFNQIWHRK
jgi:FkbM family methyltransferase